MPTTVDAMRGIMNQIASQQITNKDLTLATPYVRAWNDQTALDEKGEMEAFPKPAFFLEVMETEFNDIGQGLRSADPIWRIHIVDEYYNAPDGTMEQDLATFDLKTQIIILLMYFVTPGVGAMFPVSEKQHFNHRNIYHMTVDFKGNLTDSSGSRLDPSRNYFQYTPAPIDAAITGASMGEIGSTVQRAFQIPKRPQ